MADKRSFLTRLGTGAASRVDGTSDAIEARGAGFSGSLNIGRATMSVFTTIETIATGSPESRAIAGLIDVDDYMKLSQAAVEAEERNGFGKYCTAAYKKAGKKWERLT